MSSLSRDEIKAMTPAQLAEYEEELLARLTAKPKLGDDGPTRALIATIMADESLAHALRRYDSALLIERRVTDCLRLNAVKVGLILEWNLSFDADAPGGCGLPFVVSEGAEYPRSTLGETVAIIRMQLFLAARRLAEIKQAFLDALGKPAVCWQVWPLTLDTSPITPALRLSEFYSIEPQ